VCVCVRGRVSAYGVLDAIRSLSGPACVSECVCVCV